MNKIFHIFSWTRLNIFPITLVVCSWLTIGNTIEYFLPLNCYRKIVSRVESCDAESYICGRGAPCEETDIKLAASSINFELTGRQGEGAYIEDIVPGDTITLYTRYWFEYPLTLGTYSKIYQLEKGNKVEYSLDSRQAQAKTLIFICGGALIFFLVFTITDFQLRNEKKHQRLMAEAYLKSMDGNQDENQLDSPNQ